MIIDGFKIGGYRSFGADIQKVGPFKKVNFFVGQNNSGKSNILRFITKHYAHFHYGSGPAPEPYEHFGRDVNRAIHVELAFKADDPAIRQFQNRNHQRATLIANVLAKEPIGDDSLVYVPITTEQSTQQLSDQYHGDAVTAMSDKILALAAADQHNPWSLLIRGWNQHLREQLFPLIRLR